jgi:hypothetical protein
MQVLNFSGAKFHKFNTETEAINFVNEHGKSDLESKTQDMCLKKGGENMFLQPQTPPRMTTQDAIQSSPGTSEVIHASSPKLKASALKQRLSVLEKKYEDSMKELRIGIDTVKECIETFCTKVNILSDSEASGQTEVPKEVGTLQECLSQLAKHYTDSVVELKAELNSLKLAVRAFGIEEGQNKTNFEKGACTGISSLSFKRNLTAMLESVGPSNTTERCVK